MMTSKLLAQQPQTVQAQAHALVRRLNADPTVPQSCKRVLEVLWRLQRRHPVVWIRVRTLSAGLGLSERTVRRALGWLEAHGFLERIACYARVGDRAANRYRVRCPEAPPRLAEDVPTPGRDAPTAGQAVRTPLRQKVRERLLPVPFERPVDNQPNREDPTEETKSTTVPEVPTDSAEPARAVVVSPSAPAPVETPQASQPIGSQNRRPVSETGGTPAEELAAQLAAQFARFGWSETWWRKLLRLAPVDRITAVMEWLQACPPGHPARPRRPQAWVYAAVTESWSEPPSWVRAASKPSVRYVAVSMEPPDPGSAVGGGQASQVQPAAGEPWRRAWAEASPLGARLREQVRQLALERMGALAQPALARQGPVWAALCREAWARLADEQDGRDEAS